MKFRTNGCKEELKEREWDLKFANNVPCKKRLEYKSVRSEQSNYSINIRIDYCRGNIEHIETEGIVTYLIKLHVIANQSD